MRVHHRITPIYLEKADIGNGNPSTIRGVQLDVTTTTKDADGHHSSTIQGFWITLPDASALSTSIADLLIGKPF